jgi:tetratricopeptide (TPR) repeat protein
MWRPTFRSRRAWAFLIIGLVASSTAMLLLVDRYLGDRAPWRSRALRREEAAALARGHAYLEQGRFHHAIRAVSGIREGSPSEAEALTIRGLAEAGLEEVAAARRDLERAWSLQPNAAAGRVLAAIYLSANENDRGHQMLLNASRIDPADFRPWYAMGELVFLRLRRYEKAIDAFQQALQRNPRHPESRVGLSEALVRLHRLRDAEPIVNDLLAERRDDPRLLTLAAEIAVELGRIPDAVGFLDRTLAIDPDRRDALVLQARLHLRQGHPREALSAAERASALDPSDVAALGLLSSIQATMGRKQDAARTLNQRQVVERRNQQIEDLLREILEKPKDLDLRCRLGRLAQQSGRTLMATQSYQAALALDPNCQPARQGLIDLGVPPGQLPPEGGAALAGARR